MGRKNRRNSNEYRDVLGFNPWKYIRSGPEKQQFTTNNEKSPRRGDIWFADLGLHPGTSVQGGTRPVLIVSNDAGNTYADTINVLPMTRHLKKPDLPCHAELDPDLIADCRQQMDPSMILAEQVTTIGKSALRNYVGRIEDPEILVRIEAAVTAQLGLDKEQEGKQQSAASITTEKEKTTWE